MRYATPNSLSEVIKAVIIGTNVLIANPMIMKFVSGRNQQLQCPGLNPAFLPSRRYFLLSVHLHFPYDKNSGCGTSCEHASLGAFCTDASVERGEKAIIMMVENMKETSHV
jgi:hypothetical protein